MIIYFKYVYNTKTFVFFIYVYQIYPIFSCSKSFKLSNFSEFFLVVEFLFTLRQ